MGRLKIANEYGNADCRQALPKSYVHVKGQRLQPLCRKLKIRFLQALVGFSGEKRHGYKPVFDGVVVSARSAPKLLQAIEDRQRKQNNPEEIAKRQRAKQRKQEREEEQARLFRERCEGIGVDPDSRTATWLKHGEVDADLAELIAFKASYRHEHTNYDDKMDSERQASDSLRGEVRREAMEFARQEAREDAEEDLIPTTWPKYLRCYGFAGEIAKALAKTLQEPQRCHPRWFKEAEIAVRRAGLDLTTLTYKRIREAISAWRAER